MIFTDKQKTIVDRMKKKYSVKNLRTFRGMEGTGVNSTLYENGKKIGNVDDEGSGGCLRFDDWNIEKRINEELKNVGKVKYDEDSTYDFTYDAETLLNEIIDKALEDKEWKRKCRTKTLVITSDCTEGQYIAWKYPYEAKIKAHIEKYYKASKCNLVEIINERYI
jgi:hypothetical protein